MKRNIEKAKCELCYRTDDIMSAKWRTFAGFLVCLRCVTTRAAELLRKRKELDTATCAMLIERDAERGDRPCIAPPPPSDTPPPMKFPPDPKTRSWRNIEATAIGTVRPGKKT